MAGTSIQIGRRHGDDRFYNAVKARQNHHQNRRSAAAGISPSQAPAPEDAAGSKKAAVTSSAASETSTCNLSRFLESTRLSVPANYLPKNRRRGRRGSEAEVRPYFMLSDLWESFKEWSAYGAGVPLLLNGSDSVVQYYVPYLSGIQLYGDSDRVSVNYRQPGEDSDGDYYRDSSSSDGSSDNEHEKGKYSSAWSSDRSVRDSTLRLDRSSLREKQIQHQEGSSSDDNDSGNPRGHLLFEFLEQDPPFIREPLADKVLDLAKRFAALKTLRSCDLLPSSWISVAWYPIYRIPTGPTLKDLDACFLTFHSLSTVVKDTCITPASSVITCSEGTDGARISLPTFGLASYKFKGSIWTPNGGSEMQLANSLLQAADDLLVQLSVYHPDYRFFASHGRFWR